MRDIYHSVYLLRRTPGTPSCGEWERRRVIHDILTSLTVRLQRQTQPTTTRDVSPYVGEWIGLGQQESYKVVLWTACHRVLKTAKALQDDLKRLGSEQRRPLAHSQSQSRGWSRTRSRNWSRTHSRTHSRGRSGNQARANSQDCYPGEPRGMCPWSPDEPPPRRRVSFCNPNDIRDTLKEEVNGLMEPAVDDLETWLEFQAGQLGTPAWLEELGAMPGIEDRHKFAWKIRASFYVPEVWLKASLEWGYTAPPSPQMLDRGVFHLEKFTYQDVRQRPVLMTIAYARCLQHWVEK